MAAIVNALDNHTTKQIGENGHQEYTWSNDIRERIMQLSFQLTRTHDDTSLRTITDDILTELHDLHTYGVMIKEEYVNLMSVMFKMIGHTRDIISGKGEYTLSYMLLTVWYEHYPELAKFAFKYFVMPLEMCDNQHQYGSWKDIKYFSRNYPDHPLVDYGVRLINDQLKIDINSETPSLVSKWIPREKSQFKELYTKLSLDYFSEYINSAKTFESKRSAVSKAKMEYRIIISRLNQYLDTVQIKQCSQNWALIDPSKQTSITMHKQKTAFLNFTKDGEQRYKCDDRVTCGDNFKAFVKQVASGEQEVKGKCIGLNDFTVNALDLLHRGLVNCSDEAIILNGQWDDNSKQNCKLANFIPMIDVSGSMTGDPLYAAIALGIRIAEKSSLGKQALTFHSQPSWINLESCSGFINMVDKVIKSEWGMNTNFKKALNMILNTIIAKKLHPDEVSNMTLVILSDMQCDDADADTDNRGATLYESIETMYAETGNTLFGKPFKPPHILFWNLRSTSGFPSLSTQPNVSMMSGFSPALINLFCEQGMDALQDCTPWSILLKTLENERYTMLGNRIVDEFGV
jgi:hypothetical protein